MALGLILTAIFLVLYGVSGLGWIAVGGNVLAIFALIAGVVLLLDGFGVIRS